ncbi:gamma-glutamyl-gamma-aminobutyrate hydrolase family protein [Lapidilactobacillus bayanensis]|uniref:gamma-glutamyl-gamma-aminobutyrate hydrolase family protein n=1 Tax=Lapidilactobacillus bayanensis TaxID=2485998 RepID=UPI000F78B72B|nr:gamma-glutamyl-gamma-aminobutyrate hydrolase family protein [Lapidilactobacillus bayanensis]
MKPIIAMPSDALVEVNPRMPSDYPAYAPHDVKEAVFAIGATPLILPFPDNMAEAQAAAEEMVNLYDALILPGGPDVAPQYFGEEPIPEIGITVSQKDEFEIALIKATLAANKPILGICRGIQIMNVAMGGTLYQDLATQDPDYAIQHTQATIGNFVTHHINLEADSRLAKLVGMKLLVNSRHHQAVRKPGKGLRVTATAPDGVIEGLESTDNNLFVGVQWHPENLWQKDPVQLNIFKDLLTRI